MLSENIVELVDPVMLDPETVGKAEDLPDGWEKALGYGMLPSPGFPKSPDTGGYVFPLGTEDIGRVMWDGERPIFLVDIYFTGYKLVYQAVPVDEAFAPSIEQIQKAGEGDAVTVYKVTFSSHPNAWYPPATVIEGEDAASVEWVWPPIPIDPRRHDEVTWDWLHRVLIENHPIHK